MIDEFNKKKFLHFIKKLDENLSKPIYIIALGGTALSLINLKDKTKDIDFFMEGIYNLIRIYKIDKRLLTERFTYFLNSYTGNKNSLQNNFNNIIKENYGEQ